MSDEAGAEHVSQKRVVYEVPGAADVEVRREIPFRGADGGDLFMDLYYPARPAAVSPPPVVAIVAGYRDVGFEKALGCRFKEMGSSVSWGRLLAASGMAAVACTNRDPARDAMALLEHLRARDRELAIDAGRIGLWASSGNAPLALSMLIDAGERLTCAALLYPLTLDLDGATAVADAAATFHFANPAAGRSVADLPRQVPLFLARAGRDAFAGLNQAMDRFVAQALAANLPVTVVNYPEAPHAFDLFADTAASRAIVRLTVAFLRFHLTVDSGTTR
jgi:hypothetical protein